MKRAIASVVAAAGVAVLLAIGGPLLLGGADPVDRPARATAPEAQQVVPAARLKAKSCPDSVARAFDPVAVTVPGVIRRADLMSPPRVGNNVPGTPPLSQAGKLVFARDLQQGIRPGDKRGNVLLNTHTWGDGTALGNRLLRGLHVGGRVVMHGPRGDLCYRVTDEVEVPATADYPRYYDKTGPHQLAIIVCSGERIGPGEWTKRTIWFARPGS